MQVLIKDRPHRSLALATDDHVLIFRHTHSATESTHDGSSTSLPLPNSRHNAPPRCMAEFSVRAHDDLSGYRTATTAKGTLGLITLNLDVFIVVVTGSSEVASVRPGETVQAIWAVEFYCLNSSDYDHAHNQPNPYPGQSFASDDMNYGGGYDQTDTTAEHPFHALRKLLSTGNFYYSVGFDLTRRLQDRVEVDQAVDIASLDEGLLWNSYMISPLLRFRARLGPPDREALDRSRMLTSVVRGFVKTLNIPPSSVPIRRNKSTYPSTLTLISRLSARRAGTRFNSRGVDDDGNVANFVETETVFWSPTGLCFSYTQIRGSVPVFWESSPSLIPGQQKIQIIRSHEATQPAFDKHFDALQRAYGAVHIVNLLSESKPGEAELTERYRWHIQRSPLRHNSEDKGSSDHSLLRETEFDCNERAKVTGGFDSAREITPYLDSSAETFGYFVTEESTDDVKSNGQPGRQKSVVGMQQNGVFRVNCLDCLDRTNLVQTIISQRAINLFLHRRSESASSDFWMRHSTLWADNGDALSKIYAGTGALKSSFTRHGKMSLAGALADARKSATRLYVNNFADKKTQNTIDLLLGRLVGQAAVHLYDPINDFITSELSRKASEYTTTQPIHIWVGTFNLNGKTTGTSADLSAWLHAKSKSFSIDYDIYVIGFQEIVELSPQQIMSTDSAQRALWEAAVHKSLNANPRRLNPRDEYILLRSGQLVGAVLMTFVKASILPSIKNVEGSIKKTGMSGIAGNKGAVAIRMDVASTSVCFVTAHLAAGFANYEERNRDYKTIVNGLQFAGHRGIEDHDSVIWLGDFNYRIGLSHDEATRYVKAHNLEKLYENDQLNIQMVVGATFPFYCESRITFPPTYKFDVGTDNYDTSEKGRIPAWTDRVLRKGTNLKQIEYNSAPLRFSDHRPVYATFECTITIVDEAKKAEMIHHLYEKRKRDISGKKNQHASDDGGNDDDSSTDAEDLMGYDSIGGDLPPASSDRRKWWLDGDKPVRSPVGPPKPGMVLNHRRKANPWRDDGLRNKEDDWVEVEKPKPSPPPPRGSRKLVVPTWEGERLVRQRSESGRTVSGNGLDGSKEMKYGLPILDQRRPPSRTPSVASTTSISTNNPTLPARPQPLPRTPSTASMISDSSKKAPPPKPAKPAALTLTSATQFPPMRSLSPAALPSQAPGIAALRSVTKPSDFAGPPGTRHPLDDTATSFPPSSLASRRRVNTSSSTGSFVSVPSQPESAASNKVLPVVQPRQVIDGNSNEVGERGEGDEIKPSLPPRRTGTNAGLMDAIIDEDVNGDLRKFTPLVPK